MCRTYTSSMESTISILHSGFNWNDTCHPSIGRFDVSNSVEGNCIKNRGLIEVNVLQPTSSQSFQKEFASFRCSHIVL